MARLATTGFEITSSNVATSQPDNPGTVSANATRSTANPRTGSASGRVTNTASNIITPGVVSASKTFYLRGYFAWSALPATTQSVIFCGGGDNIISGRLTSGGKLQLWNMSGTPAQIGSDSAATIAAGTAYYRVELSVTTDASTNVTACELRLNGITVASATGLSIAATAAQLGFFGLSGAGITTDLDDVALNDSSGAANNTWPGEGRVILMVPISDNAIGAFVAGLGGTTNLWDAVNNTPPVGVAEASATNTSQIKNRTTTNPTNYDGNLATYIAAGIGPLDVINDIIVWVNTGEDPATGTKAGTCAMVSNPAIGPSASFNYGNDAGLQGTYLGLWFWSSTAHADAPTVTKTTAPVIRVTCTSGATAARSASVDFLGAYVDYSPLVLPVPLIVPPAAAQRAANW